MCRPEARNVPVGRDAGRGRPGERPAAPAYAFADSAAVFAALDGGLGDVIRGQLEKAGLHAFRRSLLNGFHHITTSTRAIDTVDDFKGLKIRSPGGALSADFFRTLGAEAGMVPFSGMYDALRQQQFDGQSDPLGVVQSLRLYRVQTHLSLTAHWWSGFHACSSTPPRGRRCRPTSNGSSRQCRGFRQASARRYRAGQRRR